MRLRIKAIAVVFFGISCLYRISAQAFDLENSFNFDIYVSEGRPFEECTKSICGDPQSFVSREDFIELHTKRGDFLSTEQMENLKKLGAKIIQANKKHRLGSTSDKYLESFIEKSSIVLRVNLSKEEVSRMESAIPFAKSLFYDVYKFDDPHLNSKFKQIIDEIPVHIPLPAETLFSHLADLSDFYLNKSSLTEDEIDEAMNSFGRNEPKWYVERLIFDQTIPRMSGLSYVQLSPYSVRYPEDGIPTLLHELAHAISWELRDFVEEHGQDSLSSETQKHIKHWECLNKQNHISSDSDILRNQTEDLPLHPTTEEDFADYLSSILFKKAKKHFTTINLRNPLCSLYDKYSGHYIIRPYKTFAQKGKTGRYSSDFWRMLHFLTQSGAQQPFPQCQTFITAENNFVCAH